VAEDRGRVAVQRGPLVYAAEGIDNDGRVFELILPDAAQLAVDFRPDLLDGVAVVTGPAAAGSMRPFQAVPYYAWPTAAPVRCSSGCLGRPPRSGLQKRSI